ncbi:MAG: helix-turn-helix transcriptional regulator [Acidobacteriaceae bacterium]
MAKIALEVEQALARRQRTGEPGGAVGNLLARGDGWVVEDVVCNSGPRDRTFEEFHSSFSIAMVAVGTFQYRSEAGRALMTPGSLLLGNAGNCFECGHEHAAGDRCIAFRYSREFMETIARDAGVKRPKFGIPRLPPLREFSSLFARALCGVSMLIEVDWEEIAIALAGRATQIANGESGDRLRNLPPSSQARVTCALRRVDRSANDELNLATLSSEAGLSRYHFLRVFERITGLTPHQYVLRARLREAAMRLAAEESRVLDIALESGFGDVSNFNRAFRSEFGVSPREYRARVA